MVKDVMHMLAVMMMFAGVFCFAFCLLMLIAVNPAGDFLLCAMGISIASILGGMCAVLLNDER
tara:strand:+ start:194 stop:382 length:189 start_codon:yes stop_codon:yes gene_type:complete